MDDKTQKALDLLKDKYLNSLSEKIEIIKSHIALKNLSGLQQEFHKLKGSGKTYGFNNITLISTRIDLLLKNKSPEALDYASKSCTLFEKIINSHFNNESYDVHTDPLYKQFI